MSRTNETLSMARIFTSMGATLASRSCAVTVKAVAEASHTQMLLSIALLFILSPFIISAEAATVAKPPAPGQIFLFKFPPAYISSTA